MTDHQQGQQRKLGFEVPFHFEWLAERDSLGWGGGRRGCAGWKEGEERKKDIIFF